MWLFPIKINNIIVQFGIAYSVLLLGILPSPSPSPSPSPIEVRTPLQAGSEGGKSTFVQHFKNVWNIKSSNSEARIVKWVFRINTISPMFKERIHQNVYKDNCQRSSSHSAAHIWQILWKKFQLFLHIFNINNFANKNNANLSDFNNFSRKSQKLWSKLNNK